MVRGQLSLIHERALVVDLFAGGAGASTGIARALGRSVDYAVNHDPEAMMVHRANHPDTMHYGGDVFDVKPRNVTRGQKVALLWASPSCTHFSKVRTQVGEMCPQTRSLADVVIVWARDVRPTVICVENVNEWQTWGPLHPTTPDVPPALRGRPIKERAGEEFRRWVGELQAAGYVVEWRSLKAHHYGAPTSRERLFLVARCDGLPIVWPEPTHGPGLKPYRTARECIDWSIPCPSIFGRRKPLGEAAQRRIARGLVKFGRESIATVGYGERKGQAARVMSLDAPLTTIVAGGVKHALVCAYVAKAYGGKGTPGASLNGPLSTITTKDHHSLVVGRKEPDAARKAECRAWLDKWVGVGVFPEVEDLGMRPLTPRELFNCQGFPADYEINPMVRGRGLGITAQVRLVGNSVSPPVAEALVRANCGVDRKTVAA